MGSNTARGFAALRAALTQHRWKSPFRLDIVDHVGVLAASLISFAPVSTHIGWMRYRSGYTGFCGSRTHPSGEGRGCPNWPRNVTHEATSVVRSSGKHGGVLVVAPRRSSASRHAVAEAAEEEKQQASHHPGLQGRDPPEPADDRPAEGCPGLGRNRRPAARRWSCREEAHQQAQLSREELIELLRGKLSNGPAAAIIRAQIEQQTGIVEARDRRRTMTHADAA